MTRKKLNAHYSGYNIADILLSVSLILASIALLIGSMYMLFRFDISSRMITDVDLSVMGVLLLLYCVINVAWFAFAYGTHDTNHQSKASYSITNFDIRQIVTWTQCLQSFLVAIGLFICATKDEVYENGQSKFNTTVYVLLGITIFGYVMEISTFTHSLIVYSLSKK